MLEDLDFDAASIDGEDEDEEDAEGLDDEEDEDVVTGKAELMARLVGTTGMDWDDADVIWECGELEDGELDDLREDAAGELSDDDADLDMEEDEEEEIVLPKKKSAKKEKKEKKDKSVDKKSKFVLEEPEFVPSGKNKQAARSRSDDDDAFGDATVLSAADSADKSAKKRSLRFHTSKIAATSARRAAAREARLGGDDDIPYRSKQAARDAVLQRNSAAGDGGEDLDGSEWSEKDRKRAREVMEAEDAVEADDGYYDLVKKRKTEAKQAKKEEYDSSAVQAMSVTLFPRGNARPLTAYPSRTVCNRDRKKQRRLRRDLDPSRARLKRTVVLPLIERSQRETRVSRSENSTKRQRSRLRRNGPSTRAVKAPCPVLTRERRVESLRHPSRDDSKGSSRTNYMRFLFHVSLVVMIFIPATSTVMQAFS